ncbi:MAG: invasion associated locus B family protein [Hyphomicrobium sp.]
MRLHVPSRAGLAITSLLGLAITPVAAEPVVERTEAFSGWTLYVDAETPHLFCFVTSEPKSTAPSGASREAPRAYISAWPKDGVKSEVSFRMGFPVKASTPGAARVEPASFSLFGAKDRAFVSDAVQELKLVEAMRKGSEMTVVVTSERGTVVTDTYSLGGLGQALEKLRETCF